VRRLCVRSDLDSIDSLVAGLSEFKGAVLLVSHNQDFMQQLANELWIVEKSTVTAQRQVEGDDTNMFDALLGRYRDTVVRRVMRAAKS
jgi:ATPase subunit of ABC transporter with duplicated ATPase domains